MIWLASSFFAYAMASLAWAPVIEPLAVANLLSLALAFWLGLRTESERVFCGWTAFIILDFAIGCIAFPVLNPNVLGCMIAIGIAASLTCELWLVAIPLAAALVYTESRGAIFAGAAVIVIRYVRQYPVFSFTGAVAALITIVTQKSLGGSLWQRLGIWQDSLNHLTLFGTGWGSFLEAYKTFPIKTNMTLFLAEHAYNDYLELLFTLGMGAVPLIVLVVIVLVEAPGQKLILWTFLLLGLTYFPLSIPVVAQAAAFSLGHNTRKLSNGSLAISRSALSQHR